METSDDAKDLELKNILDEWKLSHLYEHFIEQKISVKVLKILQTKHIERLFDNQPLGDQVIFEHKLELWKQDILLGHNTNITNIANVKKSKEPIRVIDAAAYPLTISKNDTPRSPALQQPKEITSSPAITPQIIQVSYPKPSTPTTTFTITSPAPTTDGLNNHKQMSTDIVNTPSKANIRLPYNMASSYTAPTNVTYSILPKVPRIFAPTLTPLRYNLRNILDETSGGQVILSYYEKHQILREEHRTALINVIARYIDANGCGLSLSESNQLESQIVEMFPTEKEEFYRTNKRGRIYNKIANMKRIYKKLNKDPVDIRAENISSPSSPSSSVGFIKEEEIDQYDDYIISEWRSQAHTTEEYLDFWKRTQQMRLKHIDEIESLQQILEKWPEYQQYNGIEYIGVDFKAKYSEATVFADVFHANVINLEKLLFTKISTCSAGHKYLLQYKNCVPESQHLIIIWLLHQLFPPNHKAIVDEMGTKRKKRSSIQDSQNASIVIRGSQAALDNALQMQLDSASPPMVLILGELAGEIEQIFVYFEGIRYPMETVVQAVQFCSELFLLFNLDYPEEAVLYYHFLQTFFLNVEPEVKNTKIYTVINEISAG